MKKFIYLCCLMTLSMNIMAQISENNGWETQPYFYDDFSGVNRSWDSCFVECQPGNPSFQPQWRCYYEEWDTHVTLDYSHHHVFQRSQCQFHPQDNTLHIVAEFKGDTPLQCEDFEQPCPSLIYDSCDITHHWLYYFSGCIETLQKFLYGYFEIRCKLPVHKGAFPAFWLWSNNDNRYEEIDILEYMGNITYPHYNPNSPYLGYPYVYDMGIWFSNPGEDYVHYASQKAYLPTTQPDLTNWHTFGCEWNPSWVIWYLDGEVVNVFRDNEHIPRGYLTLKANYSIDNWALEDFHSYQSPPEWKDSDEFVIDYVKVHKLKPSDCNTNLHITSLSDWLNYDYRQKRTISIGNNLGCITVPQNTNSTLRVSEHILITNNFEIPIGAEVSFLVHECIGE